jgi:thymidylate synthase
MDNNSRQIVLPILNIQDTNRKTKDLPCTISLQLLVRNNMLDMIVNMRSNDIIWGLPYDIFFFTVFQEIIANTIGIRLGTYIHRPASLHLYKEHFDLFNLVANDFKPIDLMLTYKLEQWIQIKDCFKKEVDNGVENTWIDILYSDYIKESINGRFTQA